MKSKPSKIVTLLLVLLLPGYLLAQSVISGTVTDARNQQSITGSHSI